MCRLGKFNNSKTFIEYSDDMDDIYENTEEIYKTQSAGHILWSYWWYSEKLKCLSNNSQFIYHRFM